MLQCTISGIVSVQCNLFLSDVTYLYVCMQVRFAVLKVLQELHIRLGEAFMVLLPETIPFLAELMEGTPGLL